MDKEWIPVVSTLAGVLVGGFITSVAKWLELRYQKKLMRLQKLDDLYKDILTLPSKFAEQNFLVHDVNQTGKTLKKHDAYIEARKTLASAPDIMSIVSRVNIYTKSAGPQSMAALNATTKMQECMERALTDTSNYKEFCIAAGDARKQWLELVSPISAEIEKLKLT